MNGRSTFHRATFLALALTLVTAACSGSDSPAGAQDGVSVVATTTMLGDIASNVVGDAGTVTTLFPIGADPHEYQASAQQVAAIQNADLVIANGLGLEEGLADVLDSARADGANIVEIGPLVDPIPFTQNTGTGEKFSDDPHFWMDPLRDAEAARQIGSALAAVDPSGDWTTRAETYAAALASADAQATDILSAVPAAKRKLVTNHDALGYFAQRYGFEIVGVVIPGGSTLAEPSSAELTALVDKIKSEGVTAIFAETTEPSTLADALAAEAGGTVKVVELYTGSLGEPGSGADTLIGMLTTNAQRIAEALS
jgi:zinc/manganese transport system substrate-binding protein